MKLSPRYKDLLISYNDVGQKLDTGRNVNDDNTGIHVQSRVFSYGDYCTMKWGIIQNVTKHA